MSFLDKIKTMFNIGGMNVEFHIPEQVDKQKGLLEGKIILQAAGERTVKKILIKLDQHIKKGDGSVNIVTIGSTSQDINTTLKAGQEKPVEFKLHFDPKDNFGDKIAEKAGSMGGVIGMVGNYAANQRNWEKTYTLKVVMEIEGALWKPEEACGVKLL